MIKIIFPIDEDTLDGLAALLKMSLESEEREKVSSIINEIKNDGAVEIERKVLQGKDANEALAGIVFLAIASKFAKE